MEKFLKFSTVSEFLLKKLSPPLLKIMSENWKLFKVSPAFFYLCILVHRTVQYIIVASSVLRTIIYCHYIVVTVP